MTLPPDKIAAMLAAAEAAMVHYGPPPFIQDHNNASCPANVIALIAENERLRAAMSTAKRDGWIAGRDAAVTLAADFAETWTEDGRDDMAEAAGRLTFHIRALTPPATEGERNV